MRRGGRSVGHFIKGHCVREVRFIDFEATGLDEASRPIEVAWSQPDGAIESHLINEPGIDWDDGEVREAMAMHGITPAMLEQQGRPARWVVGRMRKVLRPGVLYSDGPSLDADWLAKLFAMVGESGEPYEVRSINELSAISRLDDAAFGELRMRAQRQVGSTHRAAADVASLVVLYGWACEMDRV